MPKIFKFTTPYMIGKSYVVWTFKQYFDEIIVIGEENIPENEPVIFAPNHLNGLMDALTILALPPFSQVKVYLSRADLFKLPKLIVKFLRFARLMPAFRIRDGYENLVKNKESFEEADEVLLNNAALCIMPEGNQGTERKIRPLVKGIFRIAFSAQQKLPENKSVSIIPIGIDYGDFIKFGKHKIVNIGQPIKVSEHIATYNENPALAINLIKEKLQTALKHLALDLSSEKYYNCFETAVEAVNTSMLEQLNLERNTKNLFFARQKAAQILNHIEKNEPETIEQLDEVCKKYKSGMQKVKLSTQSLEMKTPDKLTNFFNYLKSTVTIIISLPGILLNVLPFTITSFIPKILHIEFRGFYSSVYYGVGIIFFPLFYILQSFYLVSIFSLPWWISLLLIPTHYLAGKLSFIFFKKIQYFITNIHLFLVAEKHPEALKNLQELKRQITETLLNRAN